MLPYWLLFTLFSIGAIEYRTPANARVRTSPFLVASILVLIGLVGLRYEVGADWDSYEQIFDNLKSMSLHQAITHEEPAYAFLNWWSGELGVGVWFPNLMCAAIFGYGLYRFCRVLPNPWLAVVVSIPYLVIVVAMGYTRQGAAIGLVMAGLSGIGRKPTYRFVIYLVAAMLFHKSAIVALPLVLFSTSHGRLLNTLFFIITGILLYYFFLQASYGRMLVVYVDREYSSQGAAIRVFMNIPPALIFLMAKDRFELPKQVQNLWRNFSLASLIAFAALMVSPSSTAVDRFSLYLIPLQLFVLAYLPSVFRNRSSRNGQMIVAVLAYSALIEFVWLNFAQHAEYWVPYHFLPLAS